MDNTTEVIEFVQDAKRSLIEKNYVASMESMNLATDLLANMKPKPVIDWMIPAVWLGMILCGLGVWYFAIIGVVQTVKLHGMKCEAIVAESEVVGYEYSLTGIHANADIGRIDERKKSDTR